MSRMPSGPRTQSRYAGSLDRLHINYPYLFSETTAKGTGLEKLAGKEDPVELVSSLAL